MDAIITNNFKDLNLKPGDLIKIIHHGRSDELLTNPPVITKTYIDYVLFLGFNNKWLITQYVLFWEKKIIKYYTDDVSKTFHYKMTKL